MRVAAAALIALAPALLSAQVIDNFDAKVDWQPRPSDGVSMTITQEPAGHTLAAMRTLRTKGEAGELRSVNTATPFVFG